MRGAGALVAAGCGADGARRAVRTGRRRVPRPPGLHPRAWTVGRRPAGRRGRSVPPTVVAHEVSGRKHRRRRRRPPHAPRGRHDLQRPARQPRQPGRDDDGRGRLHRDVHRACEPRPTGFRPFIGCVPTAGGGRIPTAVHAPAAVKPGRPTRLRVRTVSFVNAVAGVTHGCNRGERLVSSTHAVAFRSRREPSVTQLAGVQSELVLRAGRLVASATLTGAARGLRAKLQIQAVCTRGPDLP